MFIYTLCCCQQDIKCLILTKTVEKKTVEKNLFYENNMSEVW